ncbi:MAG: hypothetical protein K2X38_07100 [Gemmataceae bacterium]|nr:hypothetical protein [Gemmataceae bacterium]
MPDSIVLLGAEKQAASSIALAYPERSFVFLTDQPVIDGWGLPNVEIRQASPTSFQPDQRECIVLCPRWVHPKHSEPQNQWGTFRIAVALKQLRERFGDIVAPLSPTPFDGVSNIAKGDAFHRPDGTLIFPTKPAEAIDDPHQAGILYQPMLPKAKTVFAVGRCSERGLKLGLILVHSETCARDEWITAGETIADERIADLTRRMLAFMDHRGFFTFNWIAASDGSPTLTSFRPIPRAVFGTLKNAGADLLDPSGDAIAKPGLKFVVDLTYTPYRTPAA